MQTDETSDRVRATGGCIYMAIKLIFMTIIVISLSLKILPMIF